MEAVQAYEARRRVRTGFFFLFWHFNQYLRNESSHLFSSNLSLLSRANSVGTTLGVAPCALAQLMGLSRAQLVIWCHIDVSRTVSDGVNE
jgi:hypothetical protein